MRLSLSAFLNKEDNLSAHIRNKYIQIKIKVPTSILKKATKPKHVLNRPLILEYSAGLQSHCP